MLEGPPVSSSPPSALGCRKPPPRAPLRRQPPDAETLSRFVFFSFLLPRADSSFRFTSALLPLPLPCLLFSPSSLCPRSTSSISSLSSLFLHQLIGYAALCLFPFSFGKLQNLLFFLHLRHFDRCHPPPRPDLWHPFSLSVLSHQPSESHPRCHLPEPHLRSSCLMETLLPSSTSSVSSPPQPRSSLSLLLSSSISVLSPPHHYRRCRRHLLHWRLPSLLPSPEPLSL